MANLKSKEYRIKRIDKLLLRYLDNPIHRQARKLLAKQAYLTGKPFTNVKNNKHELKNL